VTVKGEVDLPRTEHAGDRSRCTGEFLPSHQPNSTASLRSRRPLELQRVGTIVAGSYQQEGAQCPNGESGTWSESPSCASD
jgi:hypothetical protein